MRIVNIFGRPVFLDSRQEAAINLAEKIATRWEEQKREERIKEEEYRLQNALRRMEESSRFHPMAERMKREMKREMLLKNAPKHHAWEYDEFEFSYEGTEYIYSKGEIQEKEAFIEYDELPF